jgi:glycerol-3-phosphate O-acyltransferase
MIGVAATKLFILRTKERCQSAARNNGLVWADSHPAHLRGVLLSSSLQHLTLSLFPTLHQLFFFKKKD